MPKISTEFKSPTETSTVKERSHKSPLYPPIPKINNSWKTHITNSKPNTKAKNEKLKHILINSNLYTNPN